MSLWYMQLAHAREGQREAGPVTYDEVMLSFKSAFRGFVVRDERGRGAQTQTQTQDGWWQKTSYNCY
jgi:hypothetical protein